MENQVYKKLTEKEQAQIAAFYESETMKTVVKSLDLYQKMKAIATIANSPNHENTILNRGQIQGANFLHDLSKHAFTAKDKKRKQ